MLVMSPWFVIALFLSALMLLGAPHSIEPAHGERHQRHCSNPSLGWVKELEEQLQSATERTSGCLGSSPNRDGRKPEYLSWINTCRAYDRRFMRRPQTGVTRQDLARACDLDFYSSSYGADVRDGGQRVRANPRKDAGAGADSFAELVMDFIRPLYDDAFTGDHLVVHTYDGGPYRPLMYEFYVNDRRFRDYLGDVREGMVRAPGFISAKELGILDEAVSAGKSFNELQRVEIKALSKLVLDAGAFHAFIQAKAMSEKLNFKVGFDENSTLDGFAKALRFYINTIVSSGGQKQLSPDVKRVLEGVAFFSLAFLDCEDAAPRVIFKYKGGKRRRDLGMCFLEVKGDYIASLLIVFHAWSHAPNGITPEALESAKESIDKWIKRNEGVPFNQCKY
ncbi:hypothetical protein PAPHI01_2066 [Pancytospora philotis]|nr:hypothetical protein PAPHI01_2066 [Pancytospora philotis]